MEKCTYCVQRIAEARIGGDITDTPIADGTVMTACQQACPTRAITFGNINDPSAKVVAEKAEPSSYAMLAELGTRPRTTYLAKVRNRV
jgi:molybdopterin-containing oxidoreductase family iron-sulfur binding subunit